MSEAYKLLVKENLNEISSVGYMYEHVKSGARVVYIENDDDNKVFSIDYRTTPKDSTGVAHITEHSVLCGSKKYPVKDPFVELVKGSLNTFLNAITYPDKTLYPIASQNDKDFKNLMDVYMDGVTHPNTFINPEIFQQEGWHYELKNVDDDLKINGVVYNEMKGAYSSPDGTLVRHTLHGLFPDLTYANDSGGDPENIPDLTYEDFLNFYKKYYHPSNAFIYLYGKMDIEERLEYLDKEYLSEYDRIEVNSEIPVQKPFDKKKMEQKAYAVEEGASEEDATFLTDTFVVADAFDCELREAFDILDFALIESAGAPLKQALIDAGIASDIYSSFDNDLRQLTYGIYAKGARTEDQQRFVDVIQSALKDIVKNGLDKKALIAGIHLNDFRYREEDYGSTPRGLMLHIRQMTTWLYDKDRPFDAFHSLEHLDNISKKVEDGYFEDLIEKCLIGNDFSYCLALYPEAGLITRQEEALAKKLAAYKASLSKEELEKIVADTAHLKEYQSTPSAQEDLDKIPLLQRSDLKREVRPFDLKVYENCGTKLLHHPVQTNGIHYLDLVFDISDVGAEDLPYVSLLERILGLVDTQNYSYSDFDNEVCAKSCGIVTNVFLFQKAFERDNNRIVFEVKSKFLNREFEDIEALIEEMLIRSDFSDDKRLVDLISEDASRIEMAIQNTGHKIAVMENGSRYSKKEVVSTLVSGIAYQEFIKDVADNFDERKESLKANLNRVCRTMFCADRLLVSSTGDDEALEQSKRLIAKLHDTLFPYNSFPAKEEIKCAKGNVGLTNAGQVQYVCRGGNFLDAGFKYNGAYKLLNTVLGYDYFWNNIRVEGGAYGVMLGATRNGDVHFVSYRDPHLSRTKDIFDKTGDYLRNYTADEKEMTKVIIGTISNMDTPLTPSAKGRRGLSAYMTGVTIEDLQRERNEVLDATEESVRALADPIEAILSQQYTCVVGNETKVKAAAELFDEIKPLIED